MDIILFDIEKKLIQAWSRVFKEIEEVRICNKEFSDLMAECQKKSRLNIMVCTAGNAFGIMDGGLDYSVKQYFGNELQEKIQEAIYDTYLGEQPVGTALVVETKYKGIKLCHTPTMRIPQPVIDPRIIFTCMRSTLIAAKKNKVDTVLIPGFAHLSGRVPASIVSSLMYRAYLDYMDSVKERRKNLTWEYINEYKSIDDVLIGRFI